MNYSDSFKNRVKGFIMSPANYRSTVQRVQTLDGSNLFCYVKNTPMLSPQIFKGHEDGVAALYMSGMAPFRIIKAEQVIDHYSNYGIRKILLNSNTYYVCGGFLFNVDKVPLVVVCSNTTDTRMQGVSNIVCFDYSVFENQEDPMNRFLIRKFIPYLIEDKKNSFSELAAGYMFVHGKSFIIKPTFQGELDHNLVGKYLSERIKYELD